MLEMQLEIAHHDFWHEGGSISSHLFSPLPHLVLAAHFVATVIRVKSRSRIVVVVVVVG